MEFFKNIISKVFSQPEEMEMGKVPLHNDILKRSDDFKARYAEWVALQQHFDILEQIRNSILNEGDFPVVRIRQQGIAGFSIGLEKVLIDNTTARMIHEFMKERVKALNYKMGSTHEEIYMHGGKPHRSERYYLKPRPSSFEKPYDQRYGNVLLELGFKEEKPDFLKCTVTWYSGLDYTEAKPYEELLGEMLH